MHEQGQMTPPISRDRRLSINCSFVTNMSMLKGGVCCMVQKCFDISVYVSVVRRKLTKDTKVKFALEQDIKEQRMGRVISLMFL